MKNIKVKQVYKDYCPLCGSRFYSDTPDEMCELIVKHIDDGTCEKNFRPLDVVLNDRGE